MILLVLFVAGFVARAIAGAIFLGPAYPDSFYYVNVAHQLAAGHGFTVDYIWNFVDVGGTIPPNPTLPIPSNAHWMPLASLVQVPFIWLLGPTPLAAALPFWIIGALAAPLTYLIAKDAGTSRVVAITAGVLAAVPAGLLPFMAQPDNIGMYMVLGGLALFLGARAWKGDLRALMVGGLVVGAATLSRTDGLLLGIPFAIAGLAQLWRSRRIRAEAGRWLIAGAVSLGVFLLVVAPWFLRQLAVFGSLTPSAAAGILWVTKYEQLWSVSDPPTIQSFLAQGLGPLLMSRLGGLVAAVGIFVIWPLATVLAPFALIGAWLRRRDSRFWAFFVYGAIFFAASVLLWAIHIPYGTFIHSSASLLPHAFVLTALGLEAVALWLAARRKGWQVQRATIMFASAAIIVSVLAAAIQTISTMRVWQHDQTVRQQLIGMVTGVAAGERLMSGDSGAYEYLFDRPGIASPDDPLPVIEEAARAYDIRWLSLERDHVVAALAPVLLGRVRPTWLSAPIATVASTTGDGPPAAVLYAVCLTPDDTRCTP
jgi:4-amino-4-deoxy-L-arabinose transferase-like glycosyltransferase